MRRLRLCRRDLEIDAGVIWATDDGGFSVISRSLADIVVAIRECEQAHLAGFPPRWESRRHDVSMVAGIAKAIPVEAVDDDPFGATESAIHRTEPEFCDGISLWWIAKHGVVRAFFTRDQAWAWSNTVDMGNVERADRDFVDDLENDRF